MPEPVKHSSKVAVRRIERRRRQPNGDPIDWLSSDEGIGAISDLVGILIEHLDDRVALTRANTVNWCNSPEGEKVFREIRDIVSAITSISLGCKHRCLFNFVRDHFGRGYYKKLYESIKTQAMK